MSRTKVIEVAKAPQGILYEMQQGITSKTSAEKWGEKRGYRVVYFAAKKQRVYADRAQVRVDEQAAKLEQASAELVKVAEGMLVSTGYASLSTGYASL